MLYHYTLTSTVCAEKSEIIIITVLLYITFFIPLLIAFKICSLFPVISSLTMIYLGCGVVVCFVFILTRVCRNYQIYTLITSINCGKLLPFISWIILFLCPSPFFQGSQLWNWQHLTDFGCLLKISFSSLCVSVWILSTYLTLYGHFIRWLDTAEERVSESDQDF